ncbi:Mur ligase family protein, partial [Candidatus Dependentiae bacterium]
MSSDTLMPKTFPVACHTSRVGPGSTFVAIKGEKHDGISYISRALASGASTIAIQQDVNLSDDVLKDIERAGASLQRVSNTRKALATLSAQAHGNPAQQLRIIGVTGTKGKSSTVFMLEHILQRAGYKTALLSSVYNKIGDEITSSSLTTEHPDYLHGFFALCVDAGIEFVVMEVAAQALSLHRVEGIEFDGVLFTNFAKEHGEFYKDLDSYFDAKRLLFGQLKQGAPA